MMQSCHSARRANMLHMPHCFISLSKADVIVALWRVMHRQTTQSSFEISVATVSQTSLAPFANNVQPAGGSAFCVHGSNCSSSWMDQCGIPANSSVVMGPLYIISDQASGFSSWAVGQSQRTQSMTSSVATAESRRDRFRSSKSTKLIDTTDEAAAANLEMARRACTTWKSRNKVQPLEGEGANNCGNTVTFLCPTGDFGSGRQKPKLVRQLTGYLYAPEEIEVEDSQEIEEECEEDILLARVKAHAQEQAKQMRFPHQQQRNVDYLASKAMSSLGCTGFPVGPSELSHTCNLL